MKKFKITPHLKAQLSTAMKSELAIDELFIILKTENGPSLTYAKSGGPVPPDPTHPVPPTVAD